MPCPISSTCTYHGTSCISDLNRGIGVGGAFDLVTAVELPVTPVIVGALRLLHPRCLERCWRAFCAGRFRYGG